MSTPMANPNSSDPLLGVIDLADDIAPVDVWQGLHYNAVAWRDIPDDVGQDAQRAQIDASDLSLLGVLSEYPADRWMNLCDATGWTVYGAIALSWCSGAELANVWEGWLASGYPLLPTPECERPARLLNPALLPETRNLSGLIAASTPSTLGLCAMIAASDKPLTIDLSAQQLKNAPAQIASFLKSSLLSSGHKGEVDRGLLSVLERNIANTEFDVWGTSIREKTRPPMAAM
jgi:hypothetical protein